MPSLTPVVIRRSYPRELESKDRPIMLRVMSAADANAMLTFARALPDEYFTFVHLDFSQEGVVSEWIRSIELGQVLTILAERNGTIVGYVSLWQNEFMWTSHIGEIRLLVAPQYREGDLARGLMMEAVELADQMNLERVYCQISADELATRQMLEELNFNTDALLQDWLLAADGTHHDLLMLSRLVEESGV